MKVGKIDTKNWFKFEGDIDAHNKRFLGVAGWFMLLIGWWVSSLLVNSSNLPSPIAVFKTYGELLLGAKYTFTTVGALIEELFATNHLLYHIGFSTLVNVLGYIEAVAIAIPLGFLIALFPGPRYALAQPLNSGRFLPLPAATGIFIVAFGSAIGMKAHFLAAGILVYLLPLVVQRVNETEESHRQTMTTLNASNWQKMIHLYFPSVLSRVVVDIIVLVAISWTYITVIEVINRQGGLGAIAAIASRGRSDIVYAILVLVILFGTLQDKIFRSWDRSYFKHKYE